MTVAVLDPEDGERFKLNEADVEIRTTRGSGPGGQHRNKTDSCVIATHTPTGMSVRIDSKSQHQNRALALQVLAARLADEAAERNRFARDASRKEQMGSGMRGDKVRTYRSQDDRVTDHRTNRTWSLKAWTRGTWD